MSQKSSNRPATVPFYLKIWQLLSSPRLTLFVILVLVLVCLVGVFLVQAPSEITSDPASYSVWVESVARPKYGDWAGFLSAIRFFDVFHSPWFIFIGSLLMINILACTVKRWNSVVNAVRGGEVTQAPGFYRGGTDKADLKLPATSDDVGRAVAEALKEHRYRVRMRSAGGTINVFAQKNHFSPMGTFLTHLSLILFVLGFVVTAVWGFNQSSFILAEGSKAAVGHGTGLSLQLVSFEDEYYPDGMPKDYRSNVVLFSGEAEVAQALVRVNSPLSYRGINFYQSSFGPAFQIRITASGDTLYDEAVPLTQTVVTEGVARYAGKIELPTQGITVILLSQSFNSADPVIGENETAALFYREGVDLPVATEVLQVGVPVVIEGLEVTFVKPAQYSVFQVTHSPGIILVWIACGALILGLGLVFYLPYRQLWVIVTPEGRVTRLMVRAAGRSSPGMSEINSLLQQVKR